MSLLDTASLVVTPNGTKASKLYSVVPSSGAGDLDVTRATTATRVNSSGLIESVASNVPRLDYSNGTCPSILVEPQRTNLLTYSNDFSNANWIKNGISISLESQINPEGVNSTYKFTNTGLGDDYLEQRGLPTTAGIYTTSVFIKNINNIVSTDLMAVHLVEGSVTSKLTYFWSTNTFTISGSNAISGSSTLLTNGWVRLTFTYSITSVGSHWNRLYANALASTSSKYALIYGYQLEAGSYATSYIPTTSASVTRNLDNISKSSITSLIGQTEGTLFVDFYHDGLNSYFPCSISNGSYDDAIYLDFGSNYSSGVIFNSGSLEFSFNAGTLSVGRHKVAIGYKTNDTVYYIDGVLKHSDTSVTIPDCSRFDIGFVGGGSIGKIQTNLTALWKTRLTNTQLATLTTQRITPFK